MLSRNLSLLERLNLNENNIQELQNDIFAGLTSLKHLNLSDNKIVFHSNIDFTSKFPRVPLASTERVSQGGSLRALQVLVDVSSSIVRWARGSTSPKPQSEGLKELQSGHPPARLTEVLTSEEEGQASDKSFRTQLKISLPFKGLRSLQFLDLSENDIRVIYPELWEDLNNLTYLSLGSNNLLDWTTPTFTNTTNLTTLLLMRNSLNILTEAMVLDFSKDTLVTVDLRFNMFKCGCTIESFNETLNTTHFVEWASYQCSEDGELLSFSEYMVNATCEEGDTPHPEAKHSSFYSIRTIIIVVSISLSLVMTSVTLYKKRW